MACLSLMSAARIFIVFSGEHWHSLFAVLLAASSSAEGEAGLVKLVLHYGFSFLFVFGELIVFYNLEQLKVQLMAL